MDSDQTITCADCGKDFILTISEQSFYNSKGFSFPKRCKDCRMKRKQERFKQEPNYEHGRF